MGPAGWSKVTGFTGSTELHPKANGKRRPLGIPVIADRVSQAVVLKALEPEWEARFEPRSYGFRPGRGCHDAIEAMFNVCKGKDPTRAWVLDADLTAASTGSTMMAARPSAWFPARDRVARWLRAGVLENRQFAPTIEGTPQGGVISPLLMNIALHGMEVAAACSVQALAFNARVGSTGHAGAGQVRRRPAGALPLVMAAYHQLWHVEGSRSGCPSTT